VTKPGVSFSSFVYSLYVSALFHLGEGPEESTPDRQLARQTIDLLAILERKTQGNLDAEEERHIKTLLHDLRLRFLSLDKDASNAEANATEGEE